MQTFEFHFAPGGKEDKNFDTFLWEPKSAAEKKLGSLNMVGSASDTTPTNKEIIGKIAEVFKESYYSGEIKTPGRSLSLAAKKVNQYLADQVKKENVSWLGNLEYGVLTLKDYDINFTKTGDLKLILLRAGQIVNIGKDLEMQEIEPYPLKIFFNVVSGKLAEGDKLLIMTKDVYESMKKKEILPQIARMNNVTFESIEKLTADIKMKGACLLISFAKEQKDQETKKATIVEKKEKRPAFKINWKPSFLTKIKLPKIKKDLKDKLKVSIKPKGQTIEKFKKSFLPRKNIIAIISLIIVLLFGLYFFGAKPNKEERETRAALENIEAQLENADSNNILKNLLDQVSALPITPESEETKNKIEKKLREINNIVKAPDLTAVASLKDRSQIDKLKELAGLAGTDLIFEDPNILHLHNDSWEQKTVTLPTFRFNPNLFSTYISNLYLLDRETCDIVKYSHLGGANWGTPKKWLSDKTDCQSPKSMAINNSIYVLNIDNSISVYHAGDYQKTINIDIWPTAGNLTQIKTKINVPFLFLLDPENKRIVVLDTEGKLIKQIENDQLIDPLYFDISNDGAKIYILDEGIIYELKI